jgi:hypothetical protein
VLNFMEALLPQTKYDTLRLSAPTSWPMNNHDQATFEGIFKEYGMWFNHVIKVEEKEMISIEHLWKFVVRGAIILCVTNQEGIDIILPICHMTKNLGPDSVTAIIIQVKNPKDYRGTLQGNLFDAMDSIVKSTMFSKLPDPDSDSGSTPAETPSEPSKKKRKVTLESVKVEPKAVIRMVTALASPEPAIVFKDRPEKNDGFDGFTAFDLWLAGLSNQTFKQIQDTDIEPYKTLLERSLASHDAFGLKGVPRIGENARELRGARRRKMAPLTFAWSSLYSRGEGLG